MGDFEKREGVSTDNGGIFSYRDYDQNLSNKDLREPVALEEYIRPFELAGFLSLPIRIPTVIAAFFMLSLTALTIYSSVNSKFNII